MLPVAALAAVKDREPPEAARRQTTEELLPI